MEQEQTKAYYAIIPANVVSNKKISAGAKLFYSDLLSISKENGKCYVSTSFYSDLLNVSKSTINVWLKELNKENLIIFKKHDMSEELKKLNLNNLGFGDRTCEWCKIKTAVLHKHHYPIPKRKGGVDIVNICPNCHHTFHFYEKSIEVLDLLDIENFKKINNKEKI